MGHSQPLFGLFSFFADQLQLSKSSVNCGPLLSETNTLPIVPLPLPKLNESRRGRYCQVI